MSGQPEYMNPSQPESTVVQAEDIAPEAVPAPELSPQFSAEPAEVSAPDLSAEPVSEDAFEPAPEFAADATPEPRASASVKRPCVALMGEFSAGKSTLSNLLLGASALPVHVTATQLPPVWISQGADAPFSVGMDGAERPVDLEDLEAVSVKDTNHIRIFHQAARLADFDLIDMPGISDPNMAADVWQRVIHHADVVIWCTHATQAWRQSEAAVWSTMPAELHERSLLLLTRMDKILSDRDRQRVIKRVESETRGLFRSVLPVSLIRALEADEGSEAWEASGATALMAELKALVGEVSGGVVRRPVAEGFSPAASEPAAAEDAPDAVSAPKAKPARIVMPTRVRPRPLQS